MRKFQCLMFEEPLSANRLQEALLYTYLPVYLYHPLISLQRPQRQSDANVVSKTEWCREPGKGKYERLRISISVVEFKQPTDF